MRLLLIAACAALLLLSCSKNDRNDPAPPPVIPPVEADTLGAWQFKTIDSLGRGLIDMVFTDANTGFVCGDYSTGFKTIDGGTTWKRMTFPVVAFFSFVNIHFVNTQYGFITRGTNADGILRTTNGGSTWQYVQLPFQCTDIFFVNPAQGYATTLTGLIKSIDSGKTWAAVPTVTKPLSCVAFLDAGKGFFTSTNGIASLYGTQNAGLSFTQLVSGTFSDYNPVWFANNTNGCAGLGKQLYITNDGGTNWSLSKTFDRDIVDAKNTGSDNYYVSTGNEVWHTSNSGSTWLREMNLGGTKNIVEFALTQVGKVWATGSEGRLYYK